jgi:hypothetical protein
MSKWEGKMREARGRQPFGGRGNRTNKTHTTDRTEGGASHSGQVGTCLR